MGYELIYDFKNNKHYNLDFLNLIKKSNSKYSFEEWMTKGHWDPNYIPFALVDDKNVMVAGVGVIKTHVFIKEHKYDTIQIGKIFIKEGKDQTELEREILDRIISKYDTIVDAIYSFDNPFDKCLLEGFSFKNPIEYKYSIDWKHDDEIATSVVKKINLDNKEEYDFLLDEIQHSSRMSKVVATSGDALIKIFNIIKYYPRNVYTIPSLDTTIVFTIDGDVFKLIAAFSKTELDMNELLQAVVPSNIKSVEFGFIPNIDNLEYSAREKEALIDENSVFSRFFIKPISIELEHIKLLMPILSREK